MDFSTLSENPFIKDLKCSLCDNYLSYFPIHLLNSKENMCGRCPVPEVGTPVRNQVYETVAKHIQFPCRNVNQGCIKKKCGSDMALHEEFCSFRSTACPASEFKKCVDKIFLPNLKQHCDENHSDLVLKDGKFTINTSESHEQNSIVIYKNIFYIFKQKYDSKSNKLTCSVYYFTNEGTVFPTFYKLCVSSGSRSCTISGSTQIDFCNDRSIDICLDILNVPNLLSISGVLNLYEENAEAHLESKMKQELLKAFTCAQCLNHIMPPMTTVYYCNKRFLCLPCGRKKIYDPLTIDCSVFNKVTEQLHYPCQYHTNGCNVRSQLLLLRKHQLNCPFESNFCPVSEYERCEWSGLRNEMVKHVNEDHLKQIATSSYFSEPLYNSEKYYIIKFSKYLFRLSFNAENMTYRWTMQIIGAFEEKFMYELEIFNSNNQRRLLSVHSCSPLTRKSDLFKNIDNCCYYQFDQLQDMLFENKYVQFRIRIFL